ncbi:MAG: hypothetical protein JW840_00415 [Candidatus Thermoplasmatota archaeon]|nr:hypothetical protein [Candidatus Thermoplasmatota archaeon]
MFWKWSKPTDSHTDPTDAALDRKNTLKDQQGRLVQYTVALEINRIE